MQTSDYFRGSSSLSSAALPRGHTYLRFDVFISPHLPVVPSGGPPDCLRRPAGGVVLGGRRRIVALLHEIPDLKGPPMGCCRGPREKGEDIGQRGGGGDYRGGNGGQCSGRDGHAAVWHMEPQIHGMLLLADPNQLGPAPHEASTEYLPESLREPTQGTHNAKHYHRFGSARVVSDAPRERKKANKKKSRRSTCRPTAVFA